MLLLGIHGLATTELDRTHVIFMRPHSKPQGKTKADKRRRGVYMLVCRNAERGKILFKILCE